MPSSREQQSWCLSFLEHTPLSTHKTRVSVGSSGFTMNRYTILSDASNHSKEPQKAGMAPAPHHSLSHLWATGCVGRRHTNMLHPSDTTAPSMAPVRKQAILVWWFTAQVGPHYILYICLLLRNLGRVSASCSPVIKGIMLLNRGRIIALSTMYSCDLFSCRVQ